MSSLTISDFKVEFSGIQSTVAQFNANTPQTQIFAVKQRLEVLSKWVQLSRRVLISNPEAMLQLSVPSREIPGLINRCTDLLPADFAPDVNSSPNLPAVTAINQVYSNVNPMNVAKKYAQSPVKRAHSPPTSRNPLFFPTEFRPLTISRSPVIPSSPSATLIPGSQPTTISRALVGIRSPSSAAISDSRIIETGNITPAETNNIVYHIRGASHAASPIPATPIITEVKVVCHVPYGHTLTIRGEGAGLDWNQGVPLQKVGEYYVYRYEGNTGPVQFKLLLDDNHWEDCNNRTIESGGKLEIIPALVLPSVPAVVNFAVPNIKLFIRGTGPGMSWDKGVELKLVNGKWVFETNAHFGPFEFKVLLYDQHWEQGENHKIEAGRTLEITPRF